MTVRVPLWLAVGGCSAALAGSALAVHPGGLGGIGDESGAALLERAAQAAEELDYHGTQFVAFWSESGSTSAIVEVSHVAGEGSVMRMEPTPQSPAGAVFRSGGPGAPEVAGFDPATIGLLHRNYETAKTSSDTVAGRAADVVSVRRPGESPVARFWLDRETGLVLRREVLDGEGRTLRASAFIRVTLGTPGAVPHGAAESSTPRASGDELRGTAVDDLRDDGWQVPAALPAGLELFDARMTPSDDSKLLHLTYSDGVSTVSLFQQRGRLDTDSLDGFRRIKVGRTKVWASTTFPRRVVWTGDGKVFTLVAECQEDTLERVVSALPHGGDSPGLRARLRNGLSRVGSWLNPF
ncbi:MAG TPA: sigma-E factor regulatory protein RseB domain-containing protein [Mycobacteriales bacterium]|nr:sigma-E factor regulatory protein RseB domain-containing protein [Mycobacteriales bacterium]